MPLSLHKVKLERRRLWPWQQHIDSCLTRSSRAPRRKGSLQSTLFCIVRDTLRKIDLEVAEFSRLTLTLPALVDTTGLSILLDADLVVWLLHSLPNKVKTYCLHHTPEKPTVTTENRKTLVTPAKALYRAFWVISKQKNV